MEKQFTLAKSLTPAEQEKILDDFPMPDCDAIQVPKLIQR